MLTTIVFALNSAATPVAAPITSVTVYSDRARVIRTAEVQLSGTKPIPLPLLVDQADSSSIQVSADGGDVERVDIAWVPASGFPRDKARSVLDDLEAVDTEIAKLTREREAWQAMVDTVRTVRPTTPTGDPLRPPPKLNAAGWPMALEFVRATALRGQAKVRDLDAKLAKLVKRLNQLTTDAQKLGAGRHAGYQVTPIVHGRGTVKLRLTYMVSRARWTPTYDVTLQPGTGKVQLLFGGSVSQETGEDWVDAQVTLSTAVPATATRYPKIPTWTIGERERFIPTARAVEEYVPPPPPRVALLQTARGDEGVWRALQSRLGLGDATIGGSAGRGMKGRGDMDRGGSQNAAGDSAGELADRDGDGIPDSQDRCPDEPETFNGIQDDDGCPDAGQIMLDGKDARTRDQEQEETPRDESRRQVTKAPTVVATPAAQAEPYRVPSFSRRARLSPGSSSSSEPAESLGLLPAGSWQRPAYAANLPASLAGGYDLSYTALAPETVESGKGNRRVALLSRNWPVAVERKLFPALAPDAYLVAELKSNEKEPLPGGTANLFVGADPAGVATLGLLVPGETVTLPLGLDRAIRPIRNVAVVTTEKGLINKDEISQYTVTIEIANPYPTAIPLRVLDQIPVARDSNVEVKLLRADPGPATQDANNGSMEWRLTVGAKAKSTITFVYSLKRKKGFRLHQ